MKRHRKTFLHLTHWDYSGEKTGDQNEHLVRVRSARWRKVEQNRLLVYTFNVTLAQANFRQLLVTCNTERLGNYGKWIFDDDRGGETGLNVLCQVRLKIICLCVVKNWLKFGSSNYLHFEWHGSSDEKVYFVHDKTWVFTPPPQPLQRRKNTNENLLFSVSTVVGRSLLLQTQFCCNLSGSFVKDPSQRDQKLEKIRFCWLFCQKKTNCCALDAWMRAPIPLWWSICKKWTVPCCCCTKKYIVHSGIGNLNTHGQPKEKSPETAWLPLFLFVFFWMSHHSWTPCWCQHIVASRMHSACFLVYTLGIQRKNCTFVDIYGWQWKALLVSSLQSRFQKFFCSEFLREVWESAGSLQACLFVGNTCTPSQLQKHVFCRWVTSMWSIVCYQAVFLYPKYVPNVWLFGTFGRRDKKNAEKQNVHNAFLFLAD